MITRKARIPAHNLFETAAGMTTEPGVGTCLRQESPQYRLNDRQSGGQDAENRDDGADYCSVGRRQSAFDFGMLRVIGLLRATGILWAIGLLRATGLIRVTGLLRAIGILGPLGLLGRSSHLRCTHPAHH
ncbi:Uncharacterised protein [Corynebacterium diphtheriae bv. mitis]|nr:Uncharacterised protein [Corynebacterium diphtheriae bv. mitis]